MRHNPQKASLTSHVLLRYNIFWSEMSKVQKLGHVIKQVNRLYLSLIRAQRWKSCQLWVMWPRQVGRPLLVYIELLSCAHFFPLNPFFLRKSPCFCLELMFSHWSELDLASRHLKQLSTDSEVQANNLFPTLCSSCAMWKQLFICFS